MTAPERMRIAVVGAGVTGLSAAWLLSGRHDVTLYEREARLGGHAHTVDAAGVAVDTGFIVYNEPNYPNFTALMRTLGVETQPSDMSFAVSLDGGRYEYGSTGLRALVADGANLWRPRFWSMLADLVRFYRKAPAAMAAAPDDITLGALLDRMGCGRAFAEDHLLPEAAAIWSSSAADIRDFPARAFVRFFDNHGLLRLSGRPRWRTVAGGSRSYVRALWEATKAERAGAAARVTPADGVVTVDGADGARRTFDRVLVATHSDEALGLAPDADREQRGLLAAIPYTANRAILHTDVALMPRRRRVWSSWNYTDAGPGADAGCAVTYWMNRLQDLPTQTQMFLSLNPARAPRADSVLWEGRYDHPAFTVAGMRAQQSFWRTQGRCGLWFAGAWLGSGFHEDGLQAGLAAAESMGGVRRPWIVPGESDRMHLAAPATPGLAQAA